MTGITLERLREAVVKDAAIRRVQRLQPVGGPGDKIFPPTYPPSDEEKRANRNAPPRHVFETRRIDGRNVLCVLIDSVQSQANRLEEALKNAREEGVLFPVIAVDFAGTEEKDIESITTLDAPHRVFDAIIRDSEHDGIPFQDSDVGKRLSQLYARHDIARAIYEYSPTSLIFGAWHSTGKEGGLGAKFPRCITSEIMGVGVATEATEKTYERGEDGLVISRSVGERPSGKRTGSRIDPLGIVRSVRVFRKAGSEDEWTADESEAEKNKKGEPVLFPSKKKGDAGRPSWCRPESGWNSVWRISSNMKVSFQAARSIG